MAATSRKSKVQEIREKEKEEQQQEQQDRTSDQEGQQGTTKSGYDYVMVEGHKVRKTLVGHRLKDDDETYEEYRMRQKMIKGYQKKRQQGETVWPSKQAGEYDKSKTENNG